MPANAITIISSYIIVSEAFAGVKPKVDGFSRYFRFIQQVIPDKEKTSEEKEIAQCGGAMCSPRRNSQFPWLKGLESCKKWLMSWFYVKNRNPKVDLIRLPRFKIGPPTQHNFDAKPNTKLLDLR